MHITREINKDIFYVGGSERRISLFENIYPLTYGVSYNSYIILDEKTALLETVDHSISELFFENIKYVLKDRKLDYLVIHHMEPDHAASIKELLDIYKDLTLVLSAQAFNMLKNFFRDVDFSSFNVQLIKEGDKLILGKHELTFVAAPMVHWPEVMLSYDNYTKTLFSADAFGTFNALDGHLFMDEYDYEHDFLDEARRYYTNIVGKYGIQVQSVLKKASTLDIKMICPLHGPILRTSSDITYLINKYQLWSTYTPEVDGVLIVYSSIYGHSENAANVLANELSNKGFKKIKIYDTSKIDTSILLSEAFKYSKLVLISSSYNAGVFPLMEKFILDLKAHLYQNRKIAIIENGTWAPSAYNAINAVISTLKNIELYPTKITMMSSISEQNLNEFNNLIEFLK